MAGECVGTIIVKKASEYRRHAEECRLLASKTRAGPQKDQLIAMAVTWEKLAAERSALVRRHPELAIEDEHREELARHEV